MNFGKKLVLAPLAILALAGTATGIAAPNAAAIEGEPVDVEVAFSNGVDGRAVDKAISKIDTPYRDEFVKQAFRAAYKVADGKYNVMVANLSLDYDENLEGEHLYANLQWDNIYYGLWIVESGSFTNHGDGDYINWGFKGDWTRHGEDGMTVRFK